MIFAMISTIGRTDLAMADYNVCLLVFLLDPHSPVKKLIADFQPYQLHHQVRIQNTTTAVL